MVTFPQIDSFSKLEKVIASNPAYAYYANNKNVAHLIVVTGVASAPGHDELVTTNNPWGEKNIQTYDDFKAGIPGDGYKMKLIDILRI